ncbi:hypothetical protein QBC40DRAFT_84670 [Triangularia verruculosa]|uniref:Uncharacterized protein n=1 Tax=Triangularia verruculosa TaxID=2587418 RepID=A0AAN6XES7_9PEZI|nr:hypothetical protein QBC40DRAFT_84670 [Triangularia verruculosa]
MNRFRTKKKQKEVESSTARSSEDSEQSSLPFRGFRSRKKVQQEETKPEFDLATALPSTDDFRTSLLMSNLSARFSMLREQDDPNTKIGKASDDSVLYPKRQSRMADFGFSGGAGLADIAEVESIRAATFARKDSFASDDTEMKAGVMNRAKPLEGNNLFGGRQKVYKIPTGSKAAAGGLGGRALYDDDVPMSAFQKWRQAERERSLERGDTESEQPEEDSEPMRSTSPPPSTYNQKRETSSTMSSASNAARNSTAATSITSQTASSVKDSQGSTTTTSNSGPVTRARRLYEQGLTQDLQEQQSSALSRLDTMTRHRPFGTRTPDLGSTPSPSTAFALDRSVSERRAMLAKASAPNLRTPNSFNTPSPVGSNNPVVKAPTQPEPKPNFGAAPPLSPPISETGEQSILPIQPNDVGKATALGMFQKPSQPYDESTYAQRQIQLQQGRETPTPKIRTEPSASLSPPSGVSDQGMPPTPVPDSEVSGPAIMSGLNLSLATPDLSIQRPADEDHPALRQSAMPTPLSVTPRVSSPPPVIQTTSDDCDKPVPIDSPTLGPTPGLAGLSGMVRQHLRSESTSSSIYDGRPQTSGIDSRFNTALFSPSIVNDLASQSNPWMNGDQEWAVSYYGSSTDKQTTPEKPNVEATPEAEANITEEEVNEFASQLADARRRVREKLTSYAESDSSRAGSPQPQPEFAKEAACSASSTPLGLGILKSKSSKGSIVERSRNISAGPLKVTKMLGIGAATMSTSPLPTKQSFDEKDMSALATMQEESRQPEAQPQETHHSSESANSGDAAAKADNEEENHTHPGLRAFRQARRELQKQKELETLARRQAAQTSQPADGQTPLQPPPRADRGTNQRSPPSGERRPPPVTYRPRAPSDESNYSNSPGGRDRSGSERSENGGRSHSRPPRLMTNGNMMPHDQLAPGSARTPMMRSPGLPGTDIKGSPIMPPHPYPGRGVPSPAASPMLNQSRSVGNLALHTGRLGFDTHPGQPSPISPMGLPSPSPYGAGGPTPSPAGTPTSFGPRVARQPSVSQSPALGPVNAKRIVDKREISEPTLMSATTRVPTVNLPHQRAMGPDGADRGRAYQEPRSRSNSRGGPPPLPPINPRRRRDESNVGRVPEDASMAAPRLPFASQANHSAPSLDHPSEDEMGRRRLRKARPSDGPAPPSPKTSGGTRDNSPPFLSKGPSPRMNPGMGPGGMI